MYEEIYKYVQTMNLFVNQIQMTPRTAKTLIASSILSGFEM